MACKMMLFRWVLPIVLPLNVCRDIDPVALFNSANALRNNSRVESCALCVVEEIGEDAYETSLSGDFLWSFCLLGEMPLLRNPEENHDGVLLQASRRGTHYEDA